MLFMVIETFRNHGAEAVYRRFHEKGRMLPAGLKYIDSWVEVNHDRCFRATMSGYFKSGLLTGMIWWILRSLPSIARRTRQPSTEAAKRKVNHGSRKVASSYSPSAHTRTSPSSSIST
jgi:hypothetical protein